jgi:hypothetical protein
LKSLQTWKYVYKYVTNYDVDEFIFPRKFDTLYQVKAVQDLGLSLNKSGQVVVDCEKLFDSKYPAMISTNYTMAEYMESLTTKFGTDTAMFAFENFVALQLADDFYDKTIMTDNFSSFNNATGSKSVEYRNPTFPCHLRFQIDAGGGSAYYESIKALRGFTLCLNKTVLEPSAKRLLSRWRNPLLALVNNRFGKSISNTDFVYSLNPHSATQIKGGTRRQKVGAEHGIVSHFRVSDIGTGLVRYEEIRYLNHAITMLKVDIEYFMFLVNNHKLFA